MALVARGARAFAAVRIDASDAGVRPRGRIQFSGFGIDLDLAAMALPATVDGGGGNAFREGRCIHAVIVLHHFGQKIILRTQDAAGLGMVRVDELVDFLVMAARAILGRDDGGDLEILVVLVLQDVDIALIGFVAFEALLGLLDCPLSPMDTTSLKPFLGDAGLQ